MKDYENLHRTNSMNITVIEKSEKNQSYTIAMNIKIKLGFLLNN